MEKICGNMVLGGEGVVQERRQEAAGCVFMWCIGVLMIQLISTNRGGGPATGSGARWMQGGTGRPG